MAAKTSFTVACPSCEATVPVRDPNLIGKKVDCPKCKYRFVVEDPNGDADEDRPAGKGNSARRRGEEGARPKKEGSNVLVLGGILGVVALIILGVGGYFWFLSGDDKPKTPSPGQQASNPPPITTNVPTPDGGPTGAPLDPANANLGGDPTASNPGITIPNIAAAAAPTRPNVPAPGGVYRQISNLLPPDAQSVIAMDVDRMRNCTLGQQAFESRLGFRPETFKSKIGIGVEEMARFVRAESIEQKWTFNVIRTKEPVKMAELQSAMNLKRGPKSPIQGREYYEIPPNDLIDHLSTILQSEIESREAKEATTKPKIEAGPMSLLVLDPTTVVLASLDAMEEFLNLGCKFEMKSRPAPGTEGAEPGSEASPPPPTGDTAAATPPKRGPSRGSDAPAAPEDAPSGGPQFTSRSQYLTVDPILKSMLDRLEEGDQVIAVMAQRLQSDAKIVERLRDVTGIKELEVRGMNVLGVALTALNVERFKGQVILDWFREPDAKAFEEALKPLMAPAAQALGLYLGDLRISVEGGAGGSGPGAGGGGRGGAAGGRGPGGADSDRPPPPPVGSPDGGAAAGGGPGGNPNDPNSRSKMGVSRKGRAVHFDIDLALTEKAYDRVYAISEGVIIRMRGMVDMADAQPRWYELVTAAKALPKDGVLPRATFSRDEGLGTKVGRTFPPNQRVSWMAGLLPYLGQDALYEQIQRNKSWRDEVNLKQGASLIPQFLNPRFPRPTWRAHVPSLGIRDQGATHYVGMAGVGLDAADYKFGDKDVEKKLGMFGYERRTNFKDVTDGLANTIYIIQVPPTYPRPWIAGGGATVQGAPETKSVQPFVSQQGNKRGTYALMADGSVRYIDAGISDDVFKKLCTIKGGEEIEDLNQIAPKVDPPKGPELKTVRGN